MEVIRTVEEALAESPWYPAFSPGEYRRRYERLEQAMAARDLDAVLIYGGRADPAAVFYLTNFPPAFSSVLFVPRRSEPALFVQLYNHVPQARRMAGTSGLGDVRWGGRDTVGTLAAELKSRGLERARLGLAGGWPFRQGKRLEAALPEAEFIDFDPDFIRLRYLKSEEEMAWLKVSAQFCDRSLEALVREARPGLREEELAAVIQGSYLGEGARNQLHFILTTSMQDPDVCVPRQHLAGRVLRAGDVLAIENSVSYWTYTSQILRTFTIASEPTPLYRELHAVALDAFRRITAVLRDGATAEQVVQAADVIAEAGYTICDDLLHGIVGGYLPPILRTRDSLHEPVPDFTFRENMTVVIQPNVITKDERAGVQVGEMVRITRQGVERVHEFPLEWVRIA